MIQYLLTMNARNNLKYYILHTLYPPPDKSVYFLHCRQLYMGVYDWYVNNQQCDVKMTHLNALVYNKYACKKFIANQTNSDTDSDMQLDVLDRFSIFLSGSYPTKQEFENSYMSVIKELKPDPRVYEYYTGLDQRISQNKMTDAEKVLFCAATWQTHAVLKNKLKYDLKKYTTWCERRALMFDRSISIAESIIYPINFHI